MPDDPAGPLSEASIAAAVRALAERNRHHLESMTAAERADAAQHWRELALAVLTAATAATGLPEAADAAAAGPDAGRAVFVLEDVGGDGVAVHASFHPELHDLGDGEVGGTPAQIAALEMLNGLGGFEPDGA